MLLVTHAIEIISPIIHEQVAIVKDEKKTELGQFMTPPRIAQFMADLFDDFSNFEIIHLLDPGAGCGSLSHAFLQKYSLSNENKVFKICAYEIDSEFKHVLEELFQSHSSNISFSYEVLNTDFIWDGVNEIAKGHPPKFTHAILNPPYKKMHSESKHRKLLHRVNIETINLYSAFLALSLHLLVEGGELVAIVPRSFCNGSYYKSFRKWMLETSTIKHLHLFHSRHKAFKEDNVLQENIIIHLVKGGSQEPVLLSFSEDDRFSDFFSYACPYKSVVKDNDDQFFIRIPTENEENGIKGIDFFTKTLSEIDVEVSTGPVVDFRLKEFLLSQPEFDSAPLLYPSHFENNQIFWPKEKGKKPNAIKLTQETERWLWPNDFYVVVRRMSSKEEKRRIVASLVNPSFFKSHRIGFENHLNVFHMNKKGLDELLAYGLTIFLNSSLVDEYFRSFNGHTQVNATDLRALRYPSREILIDLGNWAKSQLNINQQDIDRKIQEICHA